VYILAWSLYAPVSGSSFANDLCIVHCSLVLSSQCGFVCLADLTKYFALLYIICTALTHSHFSQSSRCGPVQHLICILWIRHLIPIFLCRHLLWFQSWQRRGTLPFSRTISFDRNWLVHSIFIQTFGCMQRSNAAVFFFSSKFDCYSICIPSLLVNL